MNFPFPLVKQFFHLLLFPTADTLPEDFDTYRAQQVQLVAWWQQMSSGNSGNTFQRTTGIRHRIISIISFTFNKKVKKKKKSPTDRERFKLLTVNTQIVWILLLLPTQKFLSYMFSLYCLLYIYITMYSFDRIIAKILLSLMNKCEFW